MEPLFMAQARLALFRAHRRWRVEDCNHGNYNGATVQPQNSAEKTTSPLLEM